jgi:hypothetical protein
MANLKRLKQAIDSIQQGDREGGARLLRLTLREDNLPGTLRATALLWLAETVTENAEKVELFNQALAADPNNTEIAQRLSDLLGAGLKRPATGSLTQSPPTPASTQPVGAASGKFYRTVGIVDGPHGVGTAFFVTTDGLLATTRYVVEGLQHCTVTLEVGLQLPGQIVRSYPEYDLALIRIDHTVRSLLTFSPAGQVAPHTPLTALAHSGRVQQGTCRETRREIRQGWFPTTIRTAPDAGGGPMFDEHNYLVGMITLNTSRTSEELYGLNIAMIRACVERFQSEIIREPAAAYCPDCGSLTRAYSMGAPYCETCGGTLPYARSAQRSPSPEYAVLYAESDRACAHCGSRAGVYDGRCLRCGQPA